MIHKYRVGSEQKSQRGQIYVFLPDHPMSRSDGFVARSKLVMAEMIGRELTPEERVYHENETVDDDDPENLRLFPNQAALASYRSDKRRKEKLGEDQEQWKNYVEKATRHRRATQEAHERRRQNKA